MLTKNTASEADTPIPEEIENFICREANKIYPYSFALESDTDNIECAKNEAFGLGAEAMYLKLQEEKAKGMRWVKASERRPDHGKLVIIRPIYSRDLAIVGADSGDASEWATDSNETWFFDDTEWLDESPDNLSALAQENERLKGERDQYARQQSIYFAGWIAKKMYHPGDTGWFNEDERLRGEKILTTAELYTLFETQNKNKPIT